MVTALTATSNPTSDTSNSSSSITSSRPTSRSSTSLKRSSTSMVAERMIPPVATSSGNRLSQCLGSIMVSTLVFAPTLIAIDALSLYGKESSELFGVVDLLLPEPGWRLAWTALAFAAAYQLPKVRKYILVGWLIDHVLALTPVEGLLPVTQLTLTHAVDIYREIPPWGFRLARYISVSSMALLLVSNFFGAIRPAFNCTQRMVLYVGRPIVNVTALLFRFFQIIRNL